MWTHTRTQTHTAVTEPTWRLINWALSKLKLVPCRQAKDKNSPSLCGFPWPVKVGSEKEKEKKNIRVKEKAKKRERCDWIMSTRRNAFSDVWPIFWILAPASFPLLIYSNWLLSTEVTVSRARYRCRNASCQPETHQAELSFGTSSSKCSLGFMAMHVFLWKAATCRSVFISLHNEGPFLQERQFSNQLGTSWKCAAHF